MMTLRVCLKFAVLLHLIALCLLITRFIELKIKFRQSFSLMNAISQFNQHNNQTHTTIDKVLVVTYLRSGSTFLADLLQQNEHSFYTFEPLNLLTANTTRITQEQVYPSMQVIDGLFACDQDIFDAIQKRFYKSSRFKVAKFHDKLCRQNNTICDQSDVLRNACEQSSLRVIKLVRLNLKHFAIMLNRSTILASPTLRVVHSRRDPRGIFNSRRSRPWCYNGTECGNIETVSMGIQRIFLVVNAKQPVFKEVSLSPNSF